MPPLLRQTVTVYNLLGETDRHATYKRTVLTRARIAEGSEASLIVDGREPGYVDPAAFVANGWTLRVGDLVVRGESADEVPSSALAWRVTAPGVAFMRHGGGVITITAAIA